MNINFKTKNPSCCNSNDGIINIQTINLETKDIKQYVPYVIEWSDNIFADQISNSTLVASGLSSGKYAFRIKGKRKCSDWTHIELYNPEILKILSVNIDNELCNNSASIHIQIDGGAAPYTVMYGTKSIITYSSIAILDNIIFSQTNTLVVIDSKGCRVEWPEPISIRFNRLVCSIDQVKPPKLYDSHAEIARISVLANVAPIKLVIYDQQKNIIEHIDDIGSYLVEFDPKNHKYIYDISNKLYPGSYILEFIDTNGCSESINIDIQNILPLSVNVKFNNNYSHKNIVLADTEFIFDTILIPFDLVVEDKSLQQLSNQSTLDMSIGDIKYKQKTIHNREYSSEYYNILCFGKSTKEWYMPISINRGFNLKEDNNIFTDLITLKIEDREYVVVPGIDDDVSSIKLIRGNFFSRTINTKVFEQNDLLSIYEFTNTEYSLIVDNIAYNQNYYYNTYLKGSLIGLDILDHTTKINLNDISVHLNDNYLQIMQKLKIALLYMNDINKNIFVSPINNISNNGSIAISVRGGSSKYDIVYKKYDTETEKLCDIYLNNNIVTSEYIGQLSSGSYIIKIKDDYGNIIRYINKQVYDDHYKSACVFIEKYLNKSPDDISYTYGDILVNILDNNRTNTQNYTDFNINLPGIEKNNDNIGSLSRSIKILSVPEIKISDNSYQNLVEIKAPQSAQCTIVGPNNFVYHFTGNIRFISVEPGVYNIYGQDEDLRAKYLLNKTYNVTMTKNSKEYILVNFKSYYNQFIVK